jgi:hypothetical protein
MFATSALPVKPQVLLRQAWPYSRDEKELTSFTPGFQHLSLPVRGLAALKGHPKASVDKVIASCHCLLLNVPAPSETFQCIQAGCGVNGL